MLTGFYQQIPDSEIKSGTVISPAYCRSEPSWFQTFSGWSYTVTQLIVTSKLAAAVFYITRIWPVVVPEKCLFPTFWLYLEKTRGKQTHLLSLPSVLSGDLGAAWSTQSPQTKLLRKWKNTWSEPRKQWAVLRDALSPSQDSPFVSIPKCISHSQDWAKHFHQWAGGWELSLMCMKPSIWNLIFYILFPSSCQKKNKLISRSRSHETLTVTNNFTD